MITPYQPTPQRSSILEDIISLLQQGGGPQRQSPIAPPSPTAAFVAPTGPANPAVQQNQPTQAVQQQVVNGDVAQRAAGIADAARKAGFEGDALKTMVAIGLAESSGDPTQHNYNPKTGDDSYGLFQINMLGKMGPERLKQYGLAKYEDLLDPITNARVAYQMSGGGKNFSDWTTYNQGKITPYLGIADEVSKGSPLAAQLAQSQQKKSSLDETIAQLQAASNQLAPRPDPLVTSQITSFAPRAPSMMGSYEKNDPMNQPTQAATDAAWARELAARAQRR